MTEQETGKVIFDVLNAWVYNETNQAGDTLNVIDASDLPIIIPKITEALLKQGEKEAMEQVI